MTWTVAVACCHSVYHEGKIMTGDVLSYIIIHIYVLYASKYIGMHMILYNII